MDKDDKRQDVAEKGVSWEGDFSCDYYHILMAQGFFQTSYENQRVCFEIFFRYLPFRGGYAIFAGLESVLQLLEKSIFPSQVLETLRDKGVFQEDFLQYLSEWKFTGTIDAPKEGEIIFPFSPILRVQGNVLECHLMESAVLNVLNYQSLIATKASRIFHLAKDIPFIEMGLRRAYGPNGALFATRAAYIGGSHGTSNVWAGSMFKIPIMGSMSHSWVMSHHSEKEAFLHFAKLYPNNQIFLLDTYNTLEQGLPNAIQVFHELSASLPPSGDKIVRAVRIDSGDLDYLSKKIREKLDQAELYDVKIMASDGLNEEILSQLRHSKAPIDIYGIGTSLVSKFDSDFPGVYKLVSIFQNNTWKPKIKISESSAKTTIAGRKNIMRFFNKEEIAMIDYVFLEEEKEELLESISNKEDIHVYSPFSLYTKGKISGYVRGEILLHPSLQGGKRIYSPELLQETQNYMKKRLSSLQERYKRLLNPHIYQVGYSYKLSCLTWKALEEHSQKKFH